MSSPLTDVDINARHLGSKPIKASKIPSLPTAQRAGNSGRHSPFSVSATGSPRYNPPSLPMAPLISPTIASKLPRKSQGSTQLPVLKTSQTGSGHSSQRPGLPIRVRTSLAPNTPTYIAPKKLTPPSSRNKPLPSPPIVQVIDPYSPPKASRTLVDAESGTLSEYEWPILRPENIPTPQKSYSSAGTNGAPSRSVSEGAVPQQIPNSFFVDRTAPPVITADAHQLIQRGALSCGSKSLLMTELRTAESKSPAADEFHAISTEAELAMESPLTHKRSLPSRISVPPRISSKRSSLPVPVLNQPGSPTLPPLQQSGQSKAGATKWPVLEQNVSEDSTAEALMALPDKLTVALEIGGSQKHSLENTGCDKDLEDVDTCQTPPLQHDPYNSNSSWSMAAGSSLDVEPRRDYRNTTRVKRLSWRPSQPDTGPVLTIYADADAIIFGRSDSIPDVPAIPHSVREMSPRDRSLSGLARRISKQTLARTSASMGLRSQTFNAKDIDMKETTPVKIEPIRSMQPPRKSSSAGALPSLSSPALTVSSSPDEGLSGISASAQEAPVVSPSTITTESIDVSPIPQPHESAVRKHEPETAKTNSSTDEASVNTAVRSKAERVLGIQRETPSPSVRKRIPMNWIPPRFGANGNKKNSSPHGSTGRSIGQSAYDVAAGSHATEDTSPSALRGAQSHDAVRPSKLRVSESTASIRGHASAGRATPSSRQNKYQPSTPVSSHSPLGHSSAKDLSGETNGRLLGTSTKKVKVKRSFRDIFYKRDYKRTDTTTINEPRQGFMTGTRSSLAKRIRDSASLSKVHLPRMSETKPESKGVSVDETNVGLKQQSVISAPTMADSGRQAALCCLEAASSSPAQEQSPATRYNTANVINNITNRVASISPDSPDRLLGIEIAEAVLHSVECFKEAKLSAEQARKHARDAELNVERARMEMVRLNKLCEAIFDVETLHTIKELIAVGGHVGNEDKVVDKTSG